MRTEAEIRRALFNWQAAASATLPPDVDEETRVDLADMQRRAKHHVDALEWVLEEGK